MARRRAKISDEENPEWTAADFARARPASEVLPAELYTALTSRRRGQRGAGKKPAKVSVTLRLDPDILQAFRAQGKGWQTLINSALRKIVLKKDAA